MIYLVNMGTGQNCKKTKLHKDKFAQGGPNCTKKILHQGPILHKRKKSRKK